MLVAKVDSKVVACIGCEVKIFNAATGEEVSRDKSLMLDGVVEVPVMADLSVDPAFRGKGIARSLVEKLQDTVQSWGYDELLLLVEATNSGAIGLYEHMRYSSVEERPNTETAYLDGGAGTGKPRSVEKRTTLAYLYQRDLTGNENKSPFRAKGVAKVAAPKIETAQEPVGEFELRLQYDHGDKWQTIKQILGRRAKAENPEMMARARYSAIASRQTSFLGATERDDGRTPKERVEGWEEALGLSQSSVDASVAWAQDIFKAFSAVNEMEYLRRVERFEMIDATDSAAEFKIWCSNGRMLHEKDVYVADNEYGYIYSGESEFNKWTETK